MSNNPLVIERVYDAPVAVVWKAITEKEQMKQWYFDLPDFKPEKGFEFDFIAGSEDKKYHHLCKVTEVIEQMKIAYTWRYKDLEGNSLVSIELFPEGSKTRVKLSHEGLETFPQDQPDFSVNSFTGGWTHIIGSALKEFVEKPAATS